MRTTSTSSSLRTAAFTVALILSGTGPLQAQTYQIVHHFGSFYGDGSGPSDLVLTGNTFYGTTVSGGTNYNGTIFKINTDGTGYSIICNLTLGPPEGDLVLISNTLYGTLFTGGTANNGSIYKINTDGGGFTNLHSFSATIPSALGTNTDGDRPQGGLVTDGRTLYGTTRYGGASGNGTVFKINTDGSGFEVIKTFSPTFLGTNNVSLNIIVYSGTNTDGARPVGGLILDGSTLYGTASQGGLSNGVVFAMQTDGSNYTVLKCFPPLYGIGTNVDGARPLRGLVQAGDMLYGTAVMGGTNYYGTVFAMKTNGTGFSVLKSFSLDDGAFPGNTLLLNGSTLYGATAAGGASNEGTIFKVGTDGANFSILKDLNSLDGEGCDSHFLLSGSTLYGAGIGGGTNGSGVVFGLTVLPQILLADGNFGIQPNGFGFDIDGISNQAVVIQTSANLEGTNWLPLQTNILGSGPLYFSDPDWINYSRRFYRLETP